MHARRGGAAVARDSLPMAMPQQRYLRSEEFDSGWKLFQHGRRYESLACTFFRGLRFDGHGLVMSLQPSVNFQASGEMSTMPIWIYSSTFFADGASPLGGEALDMRHGDRATRCGCLGTQLSTIVLRGWTNLVGGRKLRLSR